MYQEASPLDRLLQPVVEGMGYEWVGVERLAGVLRVYVDSEAGVTLGDCERISHQLSAVLDVEDPIPGPYTLEVSSPGLDRPLFRPEHFRKFLGHTVRMELKGLLGGRRRLRGQLARIEGEEVVIVENDQEYHIPFDAIGKTRLVPQTTRGR